MNKYFNPDRSVWSNLMQRPVFDNSQLVPNVQNVLNTVKLNGDKALRELTEKFDGILINDFLVSETEISAAEKLISTQLKTAIETAKINIETFHVAQKSSEEKIETSSGVVCWRKSVGIQKVGLYIPGGSAPLFSTVLMLGIPAKIAGCKEVILCTPPDKNGLTNPAILFAAKVAGVHKIYKVGGAQAIAAMAFGTESISKVYKIFGPGNQYVTCAKQLLQQEGVAIDMPAGPSEVCVLADDSAQANFVAADLLSQAEHGVDSQSLLITTSKNLMEQTEKKVGEYLATLSRKDLAEKSLQNSKLIYFEKMDDAIDFVNEYASEHLIISCNDAENIGEKIVNAGSVFLGNYSPESVGDYASGTNHTLPTNGFAKAYSGVSVDSFLKKITFQKLSESGLKNLSETVIEMALAEGLDAHALAVKVRNEN